MCYLDDILIYSTNEKEHEDDVRKVLQRLQEFGLYSKAEKCQFGVSEVGFVGFIINSDGIGMESDRISPSKAGLHRTRYWMYWCCWDLQTSTDGSSGNMQRLRYS